MSTQQADYQVGDGQIKLSIIIGDAQLGSSVVKVNKKEIDRGDDITDCLIGRGSDLKGKTLTVKTVVTDVNDKTNHTSVTYRLKGGVRDSEYLLEGTVPNEGDSITHRIIINLI